MSQPKRKNQTWILILVIVILLLIFAKPLMYLIGDSLIVSDDVQKGDLIAAVSGPEYRIKYAAELYRRGLGDTLFYTGGFSENNQRIEADWSEYLATTEGVPPEAIATDGSTVLSTYQEAERLKAYIEAHPEKNIKSIIIVTDPYHTRRARWAYQKVMGSEIKVQMAMVPFDRTGYTKQWWRSEVSRKMVLTEYFKSAFYILRYQIATGPFQKWLAQFDKF
jgi:uncharacterized SAM-binding protein YcdF (DUF218 family)